MPYIYQHFIQFLSFRIFRLSPLELDATRTFLFGSLEGLLAVPLAAVRHRSTNVVHRDPFRWVNLFHKKSAVGIDPT